MTPRDRSPRVGLAACFHETNTFARQATDHDAFVRRDGWLHASELVEAYAGTRTVVGGMLAGAAEHGLELVPIFGAYATPAGIVTAATFDRIVDEFERGLRDAGPFDGLLIELHGAMVVESDQDPETRLLTAVRREVGDIPIAVVTDLHANMTPDRVALVDVLVGYRTNPHVDTYESGVDAASHLSRMLTDDFTTTVLHRRVPVVAPPIAQRTADVPLVRLLAAAREIERRHQLIDVTVHGGYAYADVPHAGVSFTVTAPAGASDDASLVLDRLVELAWAHRDEFTVDLPDVQEALRRAATLAEGRGWPIAIADTGDNINGGGPGDTTWLLRAALAQPSLEIAATIWDPTVADRCAELGVGGTYRGPLGGRGEPLGGPPIDVEAAVTWIGPGTYVNTGPMATGAHVSMGPTAVLSAGNVDVVVQSLPVQPNDPELFRSVGLDPAAYDVVLLKGAAAIRAGWGPIAGGFIDAGTRGVTDCDLRRLPYRNLQNVWPLEATEPPGRIST